MSDSGQNTDPNISGVSDSTSSADGAGGNVRPTPNGTSNIVPPKPATFSQVYRDELEHLGERRASFESRRVNFSNGPIARDSKPDCTTHTVEEERRHTYELQEEALKNDLCGLAISGGGIRSATFGLGVLQGLAKATLLPRFDYLSTVSGGGYIGSFLSKWIHTHSFKECEAGLAGKDEAIDNDHDSDFLRIHSRHSSGNQISHLRQYSNYLAPVPGLFTLDGWLLIAIYVRNLFLNQMVLLLGAFGLVQFVRFLAEVFCLAAATKNGPLGFPAFAVILVLMTVGQVTLMVLFRRSCESPSRGITSKRPPSYWWFRSRGWAVLLALAVACCIKFQAVHWYQDWSFWLLVGVQTLAFAALALFSRWSVTDRGTIASDTSAAEPPGDGQNSKSDDQADASQGSWASMKATWFDHLSNALVGGFAGLIAGFLVALLLTWSTQNVQLNLVFSVPIIFVMFVFSEMLYVGLAGVLLDELDREWWSSINSRLLLFSFGWVVLLSIIVYSPRVFGYLVYHTDWYSMSAILGGSVGTVVSGLFAARSSATDGEKRGKLSELIASLAPAAFLFLIFCLVSVAACWLSYDVFAGQSGGNYRTFLETVESRLYFDDLNRPTPNFKFISATLALLLSSLVFIGASYWLARRIGVNNFSLHNMYANRLVRCYLGASTINRKPNVLTNFDPDDDIELANLVAGQVDECSGNGAVGRAELGPLHIINGALNRSSNGRSLEMSERERAEALLNRDRKCESFVYTPMHCGSESTGYRPTGQFAGGVTLGQALAVSGAAVSPNMGYHSAPAITALLTVFNLRLGAWFGNPMSKASWKSGSPTDGWRLLFNEFSGNTNTTDEHIYVSDGGHFENVGVYELIRRRCRFVVAVDADAAPNLHENIGRLVRMARIDFGVRIEIDGSTITPDENGICRSHVVVGRIHYGDVHSPDQETGEEQPPHDPSFSYGNNQGIIVWIALAVTGDEPGDVNNYRAMNTDFPYRTTGDQFFDENEFESYRELGEHSVESMLRQCTLPSDENNSDPADRGRSKFAFVLENKRSHGAYESSKQHAITDVNQTSTRGIFESIYDKWLAQPQSDQQMVSLNEAYAAILGRLRVDKKLERLAAAVCSPSTSVLLPRGNSIADSNTSEFRAERLMVGEMMKLLENVWVACDFQHQFLHPAHRGWLNTFRLWTGNKIFEQHWFDHDGVRVGIQKEFNPDFQRFVEAVRRLEDRPDPDSYQLENASEESHVIDEQQTSETQESEADAGEVQPENLEKPPEKQK